MKSIIFTVGLIVSVLGGAILAQTQTQSAEQELIGLENEWMEAVVKHDWEAIKKLMADEFVMTYDGSLFTKAELLEMVKSRKEEMLSYVLDEWNVHVYGDATVVMGRLTTKMKLEGKETTDQSRFADTWVKRDGRWQCVAAHNSTIAHK